MRQPRHRIVVFLSLAALIVLAGCKTVAADRPVAEAAFDEAGVRTAAAEFVSAFNALDQARFDALWAEDATVFFPQPPFPIRRVEGRGEVLVWFKRFLDSQRERGVTPGVVPQELSVHMLGPSAAVVSFHLGSDASRAARRTLVYRREADRWRIVHLHGSALTVTAK